MSLVPTSTSALRQWVTSLHNTSVVTMEQAATSVTVETTELQTKLTDIFNEKNDKQRVTDLLSYTFVLPIALIGLSSFGLTMTVVSWTFQSGRCRYDALRSRRGALSIVFATILAAAGYTAMLIGALICVIAAASLIIGFTAMAVCAGLFADNSFRLFKALPNYGCVTNQGHRKKCYAFYDTFYSCRNGTTFFLSLNISQTADELVDMSKILVPPYRRTIAEEARSHEANLHVLIAEMLRTFLDLLEHYTPRCESLPKMWLGLGAYVYKWIASPTQGLWMAIILCTLGSAPTYYGFFTTASFLQNYADSTRLHYTQARRRRRKCKYVQDALARRKLFPSRSVITTEHTGSRSVVTETPLSTSVPTSSVTRKSIRDESFRKVKQKNPSKSYSTSREIIEEVKRSTMTPGSRSSRQEPTGKSAPRESSPFGTPRNRHSNISEKSKLDKFSAPSPKPASKNVSQGGLSVSQSTQSEQTNKLENASDVTQSSKNFVPRSLLPITSRALNIFKSFTDSRSKRSSKERVRKNGTSKERLESEEESKPDKQLAQLQKLAYIADSQEGISKQKERNSKEQMTNTSSDERSHEEANNNFRL